MKKIFSLLLLLFALVSCNNVKKEIKIIIPQGAPLLSQIKMIDDNKEIDGYKLNINVVNGQDPIKSAFSTSSHDIIVSPINLGVALSKKQENFNYKLLSVITMGNIYLASTTKIEQFSDLKGKNVISFGENSINDLVVKEIFKHHELYINPTYLGNTNLTATQLVSNTVENNVYVVAEPSLSAAKLKMNKQVYTLDITKEFKNITNLDFYQAAVFIHKDLDKQFVNDYAIEYENSVKYANENTEEFSKICQKYSDYGVPSAEVLQLAISSSKLCFETNYRDNLQKLNSKFPMSFGGASEIDEKLFY